MTEILRPAADWELQEMVARAVRGNAGLEVMGHGSLRGVGRAVSANTILSTASLRGITLYEPTELVMSARSGTPLAEIETELAQRGQMLPFEPVDAASAVGSASAARSIGSVFATNLSGSRRISAGSARDHLLGVGAVNGRGELFKSGGRVMKNVTGLDLSRALTGSWGTLAVLTEVTFKVLPRPETSVTLVRRGLRDELAIEALTTAMGTPFDVSGAVHLDAGSAERLTLAPFSGKSQAVTLLRLEGFATAVSDRAVRLAEALRVYGAFEEVSGAASEAVWRGLQHLSVMPYAADSVLWRISTAPTRAPLVVDQLRRIAPVRAFYDWSGGLVWIEMPAVADAAAADVRRAVAVHGGHATLVRASPDIRLTVDVFEPLKPAVERLTRGLKAAFDPKGILNRGRMYAQF